MSSIWKTPPGSDAMPEIIVKIIGSKHFRYLAEKPNTRQDENLKAETGTALQNPMTGNTRQTSGEPSVPTDHSDQKTKNNPDDVEEAKHPASNPKSENHQKLLTGTHSGRFLDSKVNYGKLLLFLKVAASDDLQQSRTVVDSNLKKTQSLSNPEQRISPQNSSSQSEGNESLLEILKMVLRTTNGKLNVENLSLSFRKEDHSFSGCLPPAKVRAICGKHGLYLTLSLLETLLNHQDLGYQDEIKWQNFVELLSQATSDLLLDLAPGKNEKDAPEVAEISQSKAEHMKTPEKELSPGNSPDETSAPKDPMSCLKIRPISQPFMSPAMKKHPEECEAWIDRFRKLENALYLCDLSNSGVLEKDRARRLIHNYNLIYNLSLSPRKIDQALRRFRSGENMLLEPALRYLKEL